MSAPLPHGPLPDRLEKRHLVLRPDEGSGRHRALGWRRGRCDGEPGPQRLALSLRHDRRELLVTHDVTRGAVGLLPDDQATRRGRRLEPGGNVHCVAHGQRLAGLMPRADGYDGLARVHCGPGRELQPRVLLVQFGDAIEHPEAGPYGPFGIVAVAERGAEDCHDRVADELLDRSPVLLDLPFDSVVVELERVPYVLRVGPIRSRGEANQVDEEHGDQLALLATGRGRTQLRSTGLTEPSLA